MLLAHHMPECVSHFISPNTEELHMGYDPQASQPCIFLYSDTQLLSVLHTLWTALNMKSNPHPPPHPLLPNPPGYNIKTFTFSHLNKMLTFC